MALGDSSENNGYNTKYIAFNLFFVLLIFYYLLV